MLKWFINELKEAEDKNIKVHVIGHIPPGYIDCLKIWGKNFYDIISRYGKFFSLPFPPLFLFLFFVLINEKVKGSKTR